MATVTALEVQARDKTRVNVYLDGEFAFGLAAEVVLAHGIRVGDAFSEDEIRTLAEDEAHERSYAAALNFLSFRPRSRREIEQYLRKRDIEAVVIDRTVIRLEEAGLLDDRQFAHFWVENRQTFKPRGSRALRAEMRQKGLDSDVIDNALEELPEEEGVAYAASEPRLRSLQNLDDREFLRKLTGFLQRRGFPYSVAAAVARRRLVERGSTAEFEDE